MIKHLDSAENDGASRGSLKFFSRETHTIYRPRIEIVWDDSIHEPYQISSSITQTNITSSQASFSANIYTSSLDIFRVGQSIFSSSYGDYSLVSGSSVLFVSESYGQFGSIEVYTYNTSSGVYTSQSIENITEDFTYTSASVSVVSSSIISTNIRDFFTGSLGAEFTESVTNSFTNFETTQSNFFTLQDDGTYISSSVSSSFETFTLFSSSIVSVS